MYEQRISDNDVSRRDVPSFIEPLPPMILNPFMRPKPQKATNLLKLFEDDSDCEEPELVQVYLRLKPCNISSNLYEVRSDRCLITSLDTTTAGHGRRTQHNVSKMYTFSHIFGPDASQKEIFENVVKDNLRKLPDGHSFTLLTYGASGSGKTYTLMGTVASPGLVPRSLEYVFRVVDAAQQPLYKPSEGGADLLNYAEQDYELQWIKRLQRISAPLQDKYRRMSTQLCSDMTSSTIDLSNRTKYYVWVSFVEIYNEGIYDLLAPGDRRNASKLVIREDSNGTVYVKGATQAFVRTGEEAYNVMVAGKHNLQVAATGVHAQSSRSHCIFTITMLTHTDDGVRISCVRLCDLAGCERARRTRNTGARMQESRAINSSLHVLERCLHTLRRKQRATKHALVPYRESKLTRLLGAGLSGAKGEAVSMVVTLNPAPEYAHETRHVLQLAAVAKDIQINQTISEYPSSLETSQDTTLDSGAEVMRLRAENERLHFEIVQAQTRNKELIASMEERQASTADTMRSLVEEAKEITRNYYETQLQALRNELEEMAEEYKSRLSKVVMPPKIETPTRSLQNKVSQLMTEITILEEKLNAERLARARAEEEVQHLRACIEERDENPSEENFANNKDDVMSLSNSDNEIDSDIEGDPCNESLEPTFTKEDINRSRLIRQSILQDYNNSQQEDSESMAEESENSCLEISTDTIKDSGKNISSLNDTSVIDNEIELSKKCDETELHTNCLPETNCLDTPVNNNTVLKDISKIENEKERHVDNNIEITNLPVNCTEKVINQGIEMNSSTCKNELDVKRNITRGTYCISESQIENKSVGNYMEINEIKQSIEGTNKIDINHDSVIENCGLFSTDINNIEESNDFKLPRDKVNTRGKKEKMYDVHQWEIPRKASDTLVSKIINSLKCTTNSNSSLAQFEQLEKATINCDNDDKGELQNEFSNIKLLNEKRTYFDDPKKECEIQMSTSVVRKTYFDNISANIKNVTDKRLTEVTKEMKCDDSQSMSNVKEEVTENFEPSPIRRLSDESTSCEPEPVTVKKKNNMVVKKHDSLDIFGSPLIAAVVTKQIDYIEEVRESVERCVISSESNNGIPIIKVEEASLDGNYIDKAEIQHESVTKSDVNEKEGACENPKIHTSTTSNVDASYTSVHKNNNTIEEFENLYNDITAPRVTEFDLLVSQEDPESKSDEVVVQEAATTTREVKYHLRPKSQLKMDKNKSKEVIESKGGKNLDEEVLLESHAKCESAKQTTRRNLRLRRRKNLIDDEFKEEEKEIERGGKLKDIINLQSEFSDVTIDVPAPVKKVKDIPSPENVSTETENYPPIFGTQSCPSKSVTRSRRKLFTPRAEPLEESMHGDSGERVYIPRPSYHRPRARRKL